MSSFICEMCGRSFDKILSLAGHIGHCKRGHNKPVENWDQYKDLEFYPDRTCACDCNELIPVKEWHKWEGIPKFIHGHGGRGKKNLEASIRLTENNPMKQPEIVKKSLKSREGRKCSAESVMRMSISHIGFKQSEEQRASESKAQKKRYENLEEIAKISGENAVNWRGGISFLPYSPEFNERLKEQIRERDGRICQLCNKTEEENGRKLDIHHIDYDKDNLDWLNLISLCRSCHTKTSWNRESWLEIFIEVLV